MKVECLPAISSATKLGWRTPGPDRFTGMRKRATTDLGSLAVLMRVIIYVSCTASAAQSSSKFILQSACITLTTFAALVGLYRYPIWTMQPSAHHPAHQPELDNHFRSAALRRLHGKRFLTEHADRMLVIPAGLSVERRDKIIQGVFAVSGLVTFITHSHTRGLLNTISRAPRVNFTSLPHTAK